MPWFKFFFLFFHFKHVTLAQDLPTKSISTFYNIFYVCLFCMALLIGNFNWTEFLINKITSVDTVWWWRDMNLSDNYVNLFDLFHYPIATLIVLLL